MLWMSNCSLSEQYARFEGMGLDRMRKRGCLRYANGEVYLLSGMVCVKLSFDLKGHKIVGQL